MKSTRNVHKNVQIRVFTKCTFHKNSCVKIKKVYTRKCTDSYIYMCRFVHLYVQIRTFICTDSNIYMYRFVHLYGQGSFFGVQGAF